MAKKEKKNYSCAYELQNGVKSFLLKHTHWSHFVVLQVRKVHYTVILIQIQTHLNTDYFVFSHYSYFNRNWAKRVYATAVTFTDYVGGL